MTVQNNGNSGKPVSRGFAPIEVGGVTLGGLEKQGPASNLWAFINALYARPQTEEPKKNEDTTERSGTAVNATASGEAAPSRTPTEASTAQMLANADNMVADAKEMKKAVDSNSVYLPTVPKPQFYGNSAEVASGHKFGEALGKVDTELHLDSHKS